MEKISHSYRLESHPQATLYKHLQEVGERIKEIISNKDIEDSEYLIDTAYTVGCCHDLGKATTYFQQYLYDKSKKTEKTWHSLISALFTYKALKTQNIMWPSPLIGFLVVEHHHGNMKNISDEKKTLSASDTRDRIKKQAQNIIENNLEEVRKIYSDLIPELEVQNILSSMIDESIYAELLKDIRKASREKEIRYYLQTLLVYSLLTDSDKLHASQTPIPERIDLSQDCISRYKRERFNLEGLNKVREKACRQAVKTLHEKPSSIYTLTLPTGMGKTLTGLQLGLELKKQENTSRIIYSLPFLSIIDQNSKVIQDILDHNGLNPQDFLLNHHHLTDFSQDMPENLREDQVELLATSWYNEIVVTTFHQLFHTLVGYKNRQVKKLHNIINSIIILDEIQAIPHKYWLLLEEILTVLSKDYGCTIILMTATQPLLFQDNAIELIPDPQEYYNILDRVEYIIEDEPIEIDYFLENQLPLEIRSGNSLLIVADTVKESYRIYEYLKDLVGGEVDEEGVRASEDFELILLNTLLLPKDRLEKISRIKKSRKKPIVVSTQLIEAGVDVSLDTVIRDYGPLDSIIQTGGRCNRNNTKKGTVKIMQLQEEGKPYSKKIYDHLLLKTTQKILNKFGKNTPESQFTLKASKEYFTELKDKKSDRKSQEILEELSKLNFKKASEFQLIENTPKATIYLQTKKETQQKIHELTEILENPHHKDRRRAKKIIKQLNKNAINTYLNKNQTHVIQQHPLSNLEDTYTLNPQTTKKWYNKETGLKIPETDTESRIK